MNKNYVLGVLFFSALWGVCEAGLGGLLYRAGVPHASVILTVVAFAIMAVSRSYVSRIGTATLIGLLAMLFKFFNAPFWACHFAGIAMTGFAFDIVFAVAKRWEGDLRVAAAAGFLGALGSYAAFAILMTFIIKYKFWTGSMDKFYGHLLNGAIAAVGCAVIMPLMLRAGEKMKLRHERLFDLAFNKVSFATAGLWALSLVIFSITMISD